MRRNSDWEVLATLASCSLYVLSMATVPPPWATARSPRRLGDLTGNSFAVDCLGPDCGGERTFANAERAIFYGRQSTVGHVLRRVALDNTRRASFCRPVPPARQALTQSAPSA